MKADATPSPTPQAGPPDIVKLQQENAKAFGVQGPVVESGVRVFWGYQTVGSRRADMPGGPAPARVPLYLTEDQAVEKLAELNDTELAALGQRMYRAGMISDPASIKAITSGWAELVQIAALKLQGANRHVTPWQVLDLQEAMTLDAGTGPAGQGVGGGGGYKGPRSLTKREKNFTIPTAEEADSITRTMFQNLLGRDPDEAEMGRYRSLLIGKAKQNPQVTTTTQKFDAFGNTVDTSSTSAGGFTATMAQESVRDKAQADPEYGAYQAATTYMNALQQAIGG